MTTSKAPKKVASKKKKPSAAALKRIAQFNERYPETPDSRRNRAAQSI